MFRSPERRDCPQLHHGPVEALDGVGVLGRIEVVEAVLLRYPVTGWCGLPEEPMEHREVARRDVDLGHSLAVDGHLQPILTGEVLVAVLPCAVEATAPVPSEARM